ncbi:HAD family hydrolase [Microlunatus elymi]|uniref:HAD family hydrolase n=1 Tax=Microlunatus elymi TaxID=2596828 RepID=UPI00143DAC9D|nr:HAD hydrolase-like protein [Microlunatus elymi]
MSVQPADVADDRPVILFDLDGTVLDSAPGIVAAQQQALRDVGFEPPDEAELLSDLGPPPAVIFARIGLPEELITPAVEAYRRHYLGRGIRNAALFPGVAELLDLLRPHYRLATATMKLITTAIPFLQHHGVAGRFEVIGGAQDGVVDKPAIIKATRIALGEPPAEKMIMVGDRHSDISGGRAEGLRTIAVSWGYGSRDELLASDPDVIIDRPDELPAAAERLLAEVRG